MELNTILTMILLLGFVWGGFAFTLRMAVKKNEEKKRLSGDGDG
ncbi:MAG: MetS family NSS transporter small subunit [Candidatus Marinimicrobia bacterium]|nr:MetS family NSS transporter small subunit [Candidatus Neomarinimicrobiota bacterium]MCH7954383.1 MetS family NSS transporter small subunit [Candidatus Neomarinimicrobiota bacterium]